MKETNIPRIGLVVQPHKLKPGDILLKAMDGFPDLQRPIIHSHFMKPPNNSTSPPSKEPRKTR